MVHFVTKDVKVSLLIASPLLIRSVMGMFPLILYSGLSPRVLISLTKSVGIYLVISLTMYLALYAARLRKRWAVNIAYLTIMPAFILIAMIISQYFETTNKVEFWTGIWWIILFGGPIYLAINTAIFFWLKRRLEDAFREGSA